jgi:hypothetical protein
MQIFATIVAGVIVYVLGQIVQQFVLMPIKEFNKERGDTSYLLLRHQAAITNASGRNQEVLDEIQQVAASLISTVDQIPFYNVLCRVKAFRLPARIAIVEAAREVNGIVYRMKVSNLGDAMENTLALEKITDLLGVRTSYK